MNFFDGNERFEDTCCSTHHVPEQWPRRASAYQKTSAAWRTAFSLLNAKQVYDVNTEKAIRFCEGQTDKIPTPEASSFKLIRRSINAPHSPFILPEPTGPSPYGQVLGSGPCSEADESNSCTRFLKSVFKFSHLRLGHPVFVFLQYDGFCYMYHTWYISRPFYPPRYS
jgi:hypothetical protein